MLVSHSLFLDDLKTYLEGWGATRQMLYTAKLVKERRLSEGQWSGADDGHEGPKTWCVVDLECCCDLGRRVRLERVHVSSAAELSG